MAERVGAFQGAIAARAAAQRMAEDEKRQGPAPTTARSSKPARGERKVISLHQMMAIDPTLVQYEKVG